ncbi:hypothetical protein [Jiangella alkaliphila]|uniref:hypothetical protein n=1 Tax=Jiangella alkaliphila TaxID=419479 RepID=UPI00128C6783|nr:hypothetical protein [Jiangella alkaliphila]
MGQLQLSVRVTSADVGLGRPVTRFEWQVESTDPDLPGTMSKDHLYELADRQLTGREGLRLLARALISAGEDFHEAGHGDLRYPFWLAAIAHRHLTDLTVVAWTGVSPTEIITVGIPTDRFMLAVDLTREILRASTQMQGPGLHGPETLSVLQDFAARADRDVAVPDPGDPNGPPLYEGPAGEAHHHLAPGSYDAHLRHHPDHELTVFVAEAPMTDGLMAAAYRPVDADQRPSTSPADPPSASPGNARHPNPPGQPGGWTPRPPTPPHGPDHTDPPAPGL